MLLPFIMWDSPREGVVICGPMTTGGEGVVICGPMIAGGEGVVVSGPMTAGGEGEVICGPITALLKMLLQIFLLLFISGKCMRYLPCH